MAVVVTKPGVLPTRPKYKGTCPNCECEIVCGTGDRCFEDRPLSEPFVLCPTPKCLHIIRVYLNEDPIQCVNQKDLRHGVHERLTDPCPCPDCKTT